MKFFEEIHKKIALRVPSSTLEDAYKKSERMLRVYATEGNEDALNKMMYKHGLVEYALLFQLTDEYRELKRKEFMKHGKVYRV